MELSKYYCTVEVYPQNLEKLLNDVEQMASGFYNFVDFIERHSTGKILVVICFHIADVPPIFNEAEIKRKLGFSE